MGPHNLNQDHEVSVFERAEGQQRRGKWMLFGSVGLVAVSILGFLFAIFNRVDQLTLHFLSTFPMILAVGLLTGGWSLYRGARRVTIDEMGVQIDWGSESRQYLWSEIGWATVAATGMNWQKRLILYDQSGKKLVSLSEAFQDFDELVARVKAKVTDQPGTVGGEIQLRKARKNALLVASVALVMIVGSALLAWMAYQEQRAANLLKSSAVEGAATIDRLFIAPNGFTTRIEYTVTNEAGQAGSRNVEIEPNLYAQLKAADAQTIAVLYVPKEPGISRLREGEVIDKDFLKSPAGSYGLAGLVTLLCLFLLGGAMLLWKGWDIDFDSKTGKVSIKRFGEGR